MVRQLFIILGVSILLGITAGYITSQEKYFFYHIEHSKNEITKETFDEFQSNDYKTYTKKEMEYNIKNALIFGLASFAVLCILLNIKKPRLRIRKVTVILL